jgi:hypothetical protein
VAYTKKTLDKLTSVIVNYNSAIEVQLTDSTPANAPGPETRTNELLKENET